MGVCGGIGQKIGIDANLVRLVWAAFSIGSIGMGVLIYVLVGLFLPEEQMAWLDISATSRTRCRSSTPAPGKRSAAGKSTSDRRQCGCRSLFCFVRLAGERRAAIISVQRVWVRAYCDAEGIDMGWLVSFVVGAAAGAGV